MQRILVVGAGFAGATYARELAEHGYQVDVIDKRPHVAGNAYDETSTAAFAYTATVRICFIPTMNVVQWLMRFGAFVPYEHRVSVALPTAHLFRCRSTAKPSIRCSTRSCEMPRSSKFLRTARGAHANAEQRGGISDIPDR